MQTLFLCLIFFIANYLSLENILNESDHSDEDEFSDTFDADSSLLHYVRRMCIAKNRW
jgi:hypothetical protein